MAELPRVPAGKIINHEELLQQIDIIDILSKLTDENIVDSGANSISIKCPIKSHNHSHDSHQLVIYKDTRRMCCMSRGENVDGREWLTLWDYVCYINDWTPKQHFKHAIVYVCQLAGIHEQIRTETVVQTQESDGAAYDRVIERLEDCSSDKNLNFAYERFTTYYGDLQRFDAEQLKQIFKFEIAFDPVHETLVVLEHDEESNVINFRHERKFQYSVNEQGTAPRELVGVALSNRAGQKVGSEQEFSVDL